MRATEQFHMLKNKRAGKIREGFLAPRLRSLDWILKAVGVKWQVPRTGVTVAAF